MDFEIRFNCDNAAFAFDPAVETARILEAIVTKIRNEGIPEDGQCRPVMDVNGNKIGDWG